tara:strand:+ start:1259 stop:1537 length:279 start_codon:yes stop_codon:yes gene_type:complete
MQLKLDLAEPVSWLFTYDTEPTLLPRRGNSVMVPVCVTCTGDTLCALVLTEEDDLNVAAEAITASDRDVLFFLAPRAAVMEVCSGFKEGGDA